MLNHTKRCGLETKAAYEQTFDRAAQDYDDIRPGYPQELYKDLFGYKAIGPESRVLEIGAGTGKATGPLLNTGCRLIALEPGEHMAAIAAIVLPIKQILICGYRRCRTLNVRMNPLI